MSIWGRFFGKGKPRQVDDQWQVPIVQEICIAIIHQIPEEWDSAYLVLEPTEKGLGTGMTHSAITRKLSTDFALPEGEFVTPPLEVMAATRKLELGWVERQGSFKRAIISATRDSEGWEVKSDYQHED